jgi:hypothetical protein
MSMIMRNIAPATRRTNSWIALLIALSAWSAPTFAQSGLSGSLSGLVYNRSTQTFNSILTLTNRGTAAVSSPFTVVIATGTTAVTVAGASDGSTFIANISGGLAAGQSANATVAFADPTHVAFRPTIRSISGPPSCGTPNGTIITHTSNITANETWVGNGTQHIVANSITVFAPATLTIAKCAVVKLKAGVELVIRGNDTGSSTAKLLAAGDDPVTGAVFFTNNDSQPWGRLLGFNQNSFIELDNAVVTGGGNVGGAQRNAVIQMTGTSALPDPVLKVDNVQIASNAGTGIYLSNAAFTSDSQGLQITGSPDFALALPAMALGSIPSGSYTGNTFNEALVVGNANIFDNLTISTSLPIHFQAAGIHVGGLAPNFVPNLTLVLEAGVTFKIESPPGTATLITFGDLGQTPNKNAALIALGTPSSPVTFTSGASSPSPGDWAGIWLATSVGSQLNNVIIENAGGNAHIGPQGCGPVGVSHTAALIVGDDDSSQYIPPASLITNSRFLNNIGNFAIDAVWTAPNATFGPNLTATNSFINTSAFCTQSKNVVTNLGIVGCVVAGVNQSGCLVP